MRTDSPMDVSRETQARLGTFEALLKKWNPAINLVSASTLPEFHKRHILDSAQLFSLRPADARRWVDLGSGGGLPGLVVAILAADAAPGMETVLIESDARKAAFLNTVIRELSLSARVICGRIEAVAPQSGDVVSARALAPLDRLLGYGARHMAPGGTALFPKGANHEAEVAMALETWTFSLQKYPSMADPRAAILKIGDITRV
ncbi:MAG: 16S rRNA (guanine(527)-N(7))-methyltransferase RsmG [Paracoccaceae bacterium]